MQENIPILRNHDPSKIIGHATLYDGEFLLTLQSADPKLVPEFMLSWGVSLPDKRIIELGVTNVVNTITHPNTMFTQVPVTSFNTDEDIKALLLNICDLSYKLTVLEKAEVISKTEVEKKLFETFVPQIKDLID